MAHVPFVFNSKGMKGVDQDDGRGAGEFAGGLERGDSRSRCNLGGMIAAREKGNLNMNPLEKLDEFLDGYFACDGRNSDGNLFSAYCYAQGEVYEKFVIRYIEDYARAKGKSMEVCQKLKRNVPRMIQEYYEKTNEKLGASMKK